jgi:hypothetical protein
MKTKNIVLIIIGIIIIIAIGLRFVIRFAKPTINNQPTPVSQVETTLEYQNTQYGFNFTLPLSWKNYSVITNNWQGSFVDEPTKEAIKGPEIIIRHPLWTKETPRQDIPVMVFTLDQWNLIQQEKLALGAAPIGPSELGHNATYVFALPARYNFAFPVGFEEVEKIIEGKPLQAF